MQLHFLPEHSLFPFSHIFTISFSKVCSLGDSVVHSVLLVGGDNVTENRLEFIQGQLRRRRTLLRHFGRKKVQ